MSTWELGEEHQAFRAVCRRFVDNRVRPQVQDAELAGTFPKPLWAEMAEAGLLGLRIPERFGGTAADCLAVTILAVELARASSGLAITPLVSSYMAAPHITAFGTDEQQARILPGIAAGTTVAAIAVTEPGAGSDVAGIQAIGRRISSGYHLQGTKLFITNAGLADVVIVAVKTDPTGGRNGITTFVLDATHSGLSVGPPLKKMGWRSSDTREVYLDCEVSDDQVVGEVGRGFHQIMEGFQLERVVLAAMGVGLAEACLAEAEAHACSREAFGSLLASLQTVRHRLAEMDVQTHLARMITYQAAMQLDAGHPESARTVAMAKYVAAKVANEVADDAVQLFGGMGFMDESAVARHYRDARVLRIGGGTDEVQLEILSRRFRQ
jgi:acyl-CoA dehydrogenase/citronellyl-CoA dehydrogenase